MGKKTPEGINKDAIVLANGDMPIDELALYKNFTGWVQYEGGRGYRAGLTKEGSSDLVGPYSLLITPEMVGKTVARGLRHPVLFLLGIASKKFTMHPSS